MLPSLRGHRASREGAGPLPALLLHRDSLPPRHQARKGELGLRLAKQPRMQGLALLLLAGVVLCCLWIFPSLPAPKSEVAGVPSALAGANAGHVDRGAQALAPLPDGSYPLTAAEEPQETDELPVNSYLMTTLVLALAYFGASVGWLLMPNARRQAVMCRSVVDDRWWLASVHEGPSFIGVFRL
jgi:hypothetical protein